MKNLRKIAFVLCLVLVFVAISATVTYAKSERMYVTGNHVNERIEPNTDCKVVDQHNRGKDVEVVGNDGQWATLENGNYMSMDYLVAEDEAEELFNNLPMYVLGDGVRERTAPSLDSEIAATREAGEIVVVVSRQGEWYELSNGHYMFGEFLTADRQDIVPHFLEKYQDLIVVDITNQRIEYWYYGELVASGPCVTGDAVKSPTPIGLYPVGSKNNDFDMNGNPNTHVEYATYINGGIAIHDAIHWRSHFGGSIYKTNGSHGCINTELDMAEYVYLHARKGYTYTLVLP